MCSSTSPLPTAVARRRSEAGTLTVRLDDLAAEPGEPALGRAEVELATAKAGVLVAWSIRGTPDAPEAAVHTRLLAECADELRALGHCRLLATVPHPAVDLTADWLRHHGFVPVRHERDRVVLALDL